MNLNLSFLGNFHYVKSDLRLYLGGVSNIRVVNRFETNRRQEVGLIFFNASNCMI